MVYSCFPLPSAYDMNMKTRCSFTSISPDYRPRTYTCLYMHMYTCTQTCTHMHPHTHNSHTHTTHPHKAQAHATSRLEEPVCSPQCRLESAPDSGSSGSWGCHSPESQYHTGIVHLQPLELRTRTHTHTHTSTYARTRTA